MSSDLDRAWVEMKPLAEAGRIDGILSFVRSVQDDQARIELCRTLIRHLTYDDWRNKNLDVMAAVADYGTQECERLGESFLEQANVICYNTSANLCDCWGDGFMRAPRHFEKGIYYAQKALELRNRLGKGPGPKAMATWALGKHQQSLGQVEEARASYGRCLRMEAAAAEESEKPAEIVLGTSDGFLIASGYLAIVESDQTTLDRVMAVLDQMAAQGGDAKADAEIISSQLRETMKNVD